jgi:serine kinase of HPr protein (carbohydrate metabolism regulator)
MAAGTPTVHASAVLVGSKAALIRGASGTGKSKLVLDVIAAAAQGALPFARLVGDDHVHVEASGGRVLVRPVPALAGLIEARGLGVRRLAFEPVATVGFVVDLAAEDADRLPAPAATEAEIAGIRLPRLAAAPGIDTLSLVLAWLKTLPGN